MATQKAPDKLPMPDGLPTPDKAPDDWTELDRARLKAAGVLQVEKRINGPDGWRTVIMDAPQDVILTFLTHVQRTQLSPLARHIYCLERGGRWQTQLSIDGFRLIAIRTGDYAGQTPVQWADADHRWYDVWLDEHRPPAAARVGVFRRGFETPMTVVATFFGYAPRDRTGAYRLTGTQWHYNGALMIAKCAEMLALRKTFPDVYAGLYGDAEMDQADSARTQPEPERPTAGARALPAHDAEPPNQPQPGPGPRPGDDQERWAAVLDSARGTGDLQVLREMWHGERLADAPKDVQGAFMAHVEAVKAAAQPSADETS
jgi:phage recombination protein Bet